MKVSARSGLLPRRVREIPTYAVVSPAVQQCSYYRKPGHIAVQLYSRTLLNQQLFQNVLFLQNVFALFESLQPMIMSLLTE
jgi:hypothetical protein